MASSETQARLQAHMSEMSEARTERAVATGGLGGMVPPQYLVDLAAPIARAGRVTADIVRSLPLPSRGMSIIVPRQTTGATTAVQATQNTNVSNTDVAVTDLVVPIVTIAGQQDVSRQSIERGHGVDELIFADLVAAYNVNLDAQVIAGTGSGGQMLGILNTAGTSQMSAFAAPAAADTFWRKLAGAVVAVQTGRFLAPTGIVMHPRRWGWLTSPRRLVEPSARRSQPERPEQRAGSLQRAARHERVGARRMDAGRARLHGRETCRPPSAPVPRIRSSWLASKICCSGKRTAAFLASSASSRPSATS